MNKYKDNTENDDHTSFSFITNNQQDYLNLIDVYCDLVFKPICNETEFIK